MPLRNGPDAHLVLAQGRIARPLRVKGRPSLTRESMLASCGSWNTVAFTIRIAGAFSGAKKLSTNWSFSRVPASYDGRRGCSGKGWEDASSNVTSWMIIGSG